MKENKSKIEKKYNENNNYSKRKVSSCLKQERLSNPSPPDSVAHYDIDGVSLDPQLGVVVGSAKTSTKGKPL